MTETLTRERIYKFSRLSKKAKQYAIDKYREDYEPFDEWYDCVFDEWAQKLLVIGFDVYGTKQVHEYKDGKRTDKYKSVKCVTGLYFSGFCSQGDGACFDGSCDAEDLAKHLGYYDTFIAWTCADTLADKEEVFDIRNVNIHIYTTSGGNHYSHSRCRRLEITDFGQDLSPERQSVMDDFEGECEQLREDLSDELYRDLEKEYYGMMSDSMGYELQDRDYRYNKEGERID